LLYCWNRLRVMVGQGRAQQGTCRRRPCLGIDLGLFGWRREGPISLGFAGDPKLAGLWGHPIRSERLGGFLSRGKSRGKGGKEKNKGRDGSSTWCLRGRGEADKHLKPEAGHRGLLLAAAIREWCKKIWTIGRSFLALRIFSECEPTGDEPIFDDQFADFDTAKDFRASWSSVSSLRSLLFKTHGETRSTNAREQAMNAASVGRSVIALCLRRPSLEDKDDRRAGPSLSHRIYSGCGWWGAWGAIWRWAVSGRHRRPGIAKPGRRGRQKSGSEPRGSARIIVRLAGIRSGRASSQEIL